MPQENKFRDGVLRILRLPADATDEQVLTALEQREAYEAREKRISDKIIESGGALSRDMAILTLQSQDAADAARAAKTKPATETKTKPAPAEKSKPAAPAK